MERKKKTKENLPERKSSIRIWPGVLVITVVACALFLLVNYLGHKAELLAIPGFMEVFLPSQKGENDNRNDGSTLQNLQPGLETAETEYTYYRPEREEPASLLNGLQTAEAFHQRMRFTAVDGMGISRSWVTNLYTAGDCWRIEQDNTLFVSDGVHLRRSNANGHSYVTETGAFTWNNQLGIPTLEELQAYGRLNPETVKFRDTERTVYMEYEPGEDSLLTCHIAVDTGLVTEMELYVNGKQILFMYTERISVSPEICEDAELFSTADKK
ncbi:MAG: hypothetical protein E7658_09365 [Ruminococcaceae bacterium]|nr:hypothetical protein [Oscillospiraceae bacterium]